MFVVDTNVLIYAADEDSPFHDACLAWVETWRNQPSAWYVTWGILYEFLRVSTHPRVFRSPWGCLQAWSFLDALLASPSLGILAQTGRHRAVLSALLKSFPHLSGNLMHDLHKAALMQEHGIRRICTRDTDFYQFPFLEPFDPLVSA